MSNAPYYPGAQYSYPQPQPQNAVGVTGFVFSVIGFLTCGILCPLGLLISLFGLAKAPRGFATAGVITGLLGTLMLVSIGFAMIAGFRAARTAVETAGQSFETIASLQAGEAEIESYRSRNGKIPDPVTGNELVMEIYDGWDQSLLYAVEDDGSYVLRSAGPDGEFHTEDDMRSDAAYRQDGPISKEISEHVGSSIEEIMMEGGGIKIEEGDRTVEINTGTMKEENGEVEIDGAFLEVNDGDKHIRIQIPSVRGQKPQE